MTRISVYNDDLPGDVLFKESVAIDTEAMGLINHRDRLCVVQLCDKKGNVHLVKFKDDYSSPNLKRLLEDQNIVKIFHFARFDIAILRYYLKVWAFPCYCTKIASRLVRTYTDNHGLKELCNELLGVRLNKQQQSSDWGKDELTEDQLNYAANDVLYLHKIKDRLDSMLERENRKKLALDCFEFLKTRIELDLLGWENVDIFSHQTKTI
ncbi:MAG: 3'-5' exonuclease [Candidatus Mesenet longicola]|uniref:3'-5' exonuclease n=1 Tax=Candidatus Mesenet longicola TaxID=1892558 RepID=A0A8J3HTP1_9RICK|nr:MAG: 3'-5' exonuclease [Candidatus Mesenet longicola]GHM59032.1 MAG: 3'-5' exonuclease [Candidatus Mesenet longicola]